MRKSLLSLASRVSGKRDARLPAEGSLRFIVARMPPDTRRVSGDLAYELPMTTGTPEQEHALHEFIELAKEMGATGFYHEDVPTSDGMLVIRDVKRRASSPAHPEAVNRSRQDRLTTKVN